MTWDELARDLRLARQLTGSIQIYSLEGCVRQGFLDRLAHFDWDVPVAPPSDAATVDRLRLLAKALLWALAHPRPILGGLVVAGWLTARLVRRPAAGPT